MWSRIFRQLYEASPKESVAKLRARLSSAAEPPPPANDVLGDLLAAPRLAQLVALALQKSRDSALTLAGTDGPFREVLEKLRTAGPTAEWCAWKWGDPLDMLAKKEGRVVLCLVPETADEWTQVWEFKKLLGARFTLITELLLPFTQITFLQSKLGYFIGSFDRLLRRYFGEKVEGAVFDLNARVPVAGRTIIEFGPLDGCQTAELVQLGAASVTCIEARAENAIKTRTAAEVFAWPNVRIVLDDFHNADATRHGRFDIAFAHGVYYHTIAPFVFLENLRTLADTLFIGGFCATDEGPPSPWIELTHEGRTYRAKAYRESRDFTAGVNPTAYFFHGEDLMRFFRERGHRVAIVSDEIPSVSTAGRYLRFLVTLS